MSEPPKLGRRQLLWSAATVAGGAVIAGTALSASGPLRAAERVARPRIYRPAEWGARPPATRPVILGRRPDRLVVHHTASANSPSRSLRHAFALSRGIQRSHLTQGWADAGQQFTISRGGHIMVGRTYALSAVLSGRHLVRAHVANHNSRALGIENEGTYTRVRPPAALLSSLVEMLAWLCRVYGLDPHRAIVGHRDLNATACPGDAFYRLLPAIRGRVAHRLGLPARELTATLAARIQDRPAPPQLLDHGPALGPHDFAR
jgi:hypothetical protein